MSNSKQISDELEQELVAEFNKLQRQYRIMENDRKAYYVDTNNLLTRQKKQLAGLEREKKELEMGISMAKSDHYVSQDLANFLCIQQLLMQVDAYKDLIMEERNKIKEIDDENVKVQRTLDDEWRKIGGKQAGLEIEIQLVRKIRRMENTLDNSIKDFNRLLTDNNRLRYEIEHLLTVRKHYNGLYQKLANYLAFTKDEMNDIISQASQAFDQREECQGKIQTLKERWEKDDAQYQQELKDLKRALKHDQHLKEFMVQKIQERALVVDLPPPSKKKTEGAGHHRSREEDIEFYRKAFQKISKLTGEATVESLVERFQRTEEENFALFNFVNELNKEVEVMHDHITKLTADIAEERALQEVKSKERKDNLRRVEAKLEEQTQRFDIAEAQLQKSQKAFDGIRDIIQDMFNKTDAISVLPIDAQDEKELDEKNVMLFLSAIEQRATQLVAFHDFIKTKAEREYGTARAARIQESVATPLIPPKVEYDVVTPSVVVEGDTGDEDDDLKPLSRQQIQEMLREERSIASHKHKEAVASKAPAVSKKELKKDQKKKPSSRA